MYLYASQKKININDNFDSLKKRKSSNEFYSACKKERFILSFSHNFTTLLLHNFTTLRLHNFTPSPFHKNTPANARAFFILSEEWFCTLRWVNQSVLFSWARGLRMHGFSFV